MVHQKPTTSSPHTSCEIIHYSILLSETSEYHYMFLITPNKSVKLCIINLNRVIQLFAFVQERLEQILSQTIVNKYT